MLGGLSPNALSMVNTLLASAIAGGIGILAASITQLDTETLPLQIVPALAAALLARFTSFGIACAAGIGLGIIESEIQYVSNLSWFPTSGGTAIPGVAELVIFILIVLFMYLRGAKLPGRGELVEKRLPEAPRPQHLVRTTVLGVAVCAIALVVLPFDFREALINTLIGTVMALSLVVITGFVGQISVVQLTLAGVSGFTISHLAVNAGIGFPLAPLAGTAGRRDPGPDHRRLGVARPRREPGRGHARRGGRDHELRVPQHDLGRRPDRLAGARAEAARARPRAASRRSAGSTATSRAPSSAGSRSRSRWRRA